jgi:hypothetical protein
MRKVIGTFMITNSSYERDIGKHRFRKPHIFITFSAIEIRKIICLKVKYLISPFVSPIGMRYKGVIILT